MNIKIKSGYRLNVAMIVFNEENKFLFCNRKNTTNWQFPQGGVDEKEDFQVAMYRELYEEVGLEKKQVKIEAESSELLYYDIPKKIRSVVLGGKYKGQAQKYFLLRLISGEINLLLENNPEFDDYNWVPFWLPLEKGVDFKKEVYRKALTEFREYMNNE